MIARPSFASIFIQPCFNHNAVAKATGFVVMKGSKAFLITNRHVVRGRDSETNENLDKESASRPNGLQIHHHSETPPGVWRRRDEPLYNGQGEPLWLGHPRFRGYMDVVALPLTNLDDCRFYPHDPRQQHGLLEVGVSMPLLIIGFPFGVTGNGYRGVWVQGTVATELEQDWNARPCFLIDSRIRMGQSGSPVIAFAPNRIPMFDRRFSFLNGGNLEEFVGIYSGRVNAESDLGIVWKASAVVEIVESGVPGDESDVDFPHPAMRPDGSYA
jgi:hypothetical protein